MTDPELPPDTEMVARCRRGDGTAWRLLVERYQRLVYAVARRSGLDEHAAADVFQTVFSRLLEALPRLAQPERLRAWIVTTATRESWSQRKRGRRTVSMTGVPDVDGCDSAAFDVADDSPLPEELLDELQQMHSLRLAMDRLDRRCHDLLTLLFADDESRLGYEQIALQMAMQVGSIGPTRARCLARLRALLVAGPD